MKVALRRWLCAALAIGLAYAGTGLPGASAQAPAVQKAAPVIGLSREFASRQFVRDLESSIGGIDLGKELKITAEQGDKIHVILGRLRQNPAAADADSNAYQQAQQEIISLLTPEQRTRLEQVNFQNRMRISGITRAITGAASFGILNLTSEQIDKLRAAEAESQKLYESEMEVLRQEQRKQQRYVLEAARERVLKALTPEQRAEYEKLKGPAVDIDERTIDNGVSGVSMRFGRGARGGFSVPGVVPAPLPANGAGPNGAAPNAPARTAPPVPAPAETKP